MTVFQTPLDKNQKKIKIVNCPKSGVELFNFYSVFSREASLQTGLCLKSCLLSIVHVRRTALKVSVVTMQHQQQRRSSWQSVLMTFVQD